MTIFLERYDNPHTVSNRQFRSSLTWLLWFLSVMGLGGLLSLAMLVRGPSVSVIAWLVYLIGVAIILYQPRYGLYLVIFLVLVGDNYLTPWFPFTKNFSSGESLLYVHDALIVSPLESYFALIFISWLGRGAMQRKMNFFMSELFLPAMAFLVFVLFGLFYGISTGGNLNIALWESRPLFYLVAMLVLTSNLIETRQQASNLLWAALLALFIEGLIGSYTFLFVLKGSLQGVEAITEHAAAIHMNTLFVLAAAAWLYKGSWTKRLLLPLMLLPVSLTYVATQRRAAFLTLGIALLVMAVLLFMENRKAFWLIVPPLGVLALLYIGAFWNVSGALGIPAQAVKSVIAEDQADAADQSSNLYRQIENVNTSFTVHQRPLTGIGFGQKFYVIVPMPDISFFEWWQYFPHNSIIWIWLKTGVGGFIAMLFFVGTAIMMGARALWRMPRDDMSAIATTAVLYIIMHFIYAYADISWDSQSMVYVGMMMGLLGALEHIASKPVEVKPNRWPWQPAPDAAPDIRPFPSQTS